MLDFTFWTPTKMIFGAGAPDQAGEQTAEFGGSKVLVLYGGGSAVKSGLLDRVSVSLDRAGLTWKTVGGVRPNPLAGFVQQLVDEHAGQGFDFLLAVGGGSVIDTAKAAAYGLACPSIPVWDYFAGRAAPVQALPVGAVLTISAAGSETSDSAVLTNEATGEKRGLSCPKNRPRFALMDPAVTKTLPAHQTACGVVDIIMHTLDRYFAQGAGSTLTDGLAHAVLRTAVKYGLTALREPDNDEARAELMLAGSLSHNGLTGLGQVKDFSVHQLGHELSGMFDIPHGESLSATWSAWARYVMDGWLSRFAQYARSVWDVTETDDREAALAGIAATESYFASLGMPVTLGQAVGVQSDEILRRLAHSCSFGGTRRIGSYRPLDEAEIYQIYTSANH